jgi:hypothetical protein
MANVYLDTKTAQVPDHGAFGDIRTADGVTQIMEHFGYTTHTDTADANEMDIFDTSHEVPGADCHDSAPASMP